MISNIVHAVSKVMLIMQPGGRDVHSLGHQSFHFWDSRGDTDEGDELITADQLSDGPLKVHLGWELRRHDASLVITESPSLFDSNPILRSPSLYAALWVYKGLIRGGVGIAEWAYAAPLAPSTARERDRKNPSRRASQQISRPRRQYALL